MGMDIGKIGNNNALFKRKFRWLFYLKCNSGFQVIGESTGHKCKISGRPAISFNEQEINHVAETVYLPARATWSPLDITLYDLKDEDYVYQWLIKFYNPKTGIINPVAGSSKPKATGNVYMLDGHANIIEKWELQGCWPLNINWGDLDYSISETADVSISMRYDRAILL